MNARAKNLTSKLLQWVVILILLIPTYNKLTGDATAVELFADLGLDANARIGVGVVELITMVLLLFRGTIWLGSLLGSSAMMGAIFAHIYLGKYALDYGSGGSDGGLTMLLGVVALFCCMALLTLNEEYFPFFKEWKKRDLECVRNRDA